MPPATIPSTYSFEPIGLLRTNLHWRYEAPRQAEFSQSDARIELKPGRGFEQALEDLDGFERIWIVFIFHLNQTWRPKVAPPFAPEKRRYGVFSTRSPHRPNPIGLSCVELAGIDGLTVRLRHCDILDRTPILDIKPYIPAADAFPNAKAGWRDAVRPRAWELDFAPEFLARAAWIERETGLDLVNFCRVQLRHDPFDASRKRVKPTDSGEWDIHCRTWVVRFRMISEQDSTLRILSVRTNYAPQDLAPDAQDSYGDKDAHRKFLLLFGSGS